MVQTPQPWRLTVEVQLDQACSWPLYSILEQTGKELTLKQEVVDILKVDSSAMGLIYPTLFRPFAGLS